MDGKLFSHSKVSNAVCSLTLIAPREIILGQKLEVQTVIKNRSSTDLFLAYHDPVSLWHFEITNAARTKVEATAKGRAKNEFGALQGATWDRAVQPGFQLARITDITPYFNLTQPSGYRVKVWGFLGPGPEGTSRIDSEYLDFRVKPSPIPSTTSGSATPKSR